MTLTPGIDLSIPEVIEPTPEVRGAETPTNKVPGNMRHPSLFIAADTVDASALSDLAALARGNEVGLKVGLEAFYFLGVDAIAKATADCHLFLDLKLHDIPNTVRGGLAGLSQHLSPRVITVHASGGAAMLSAAAGFQDHTDIAGVTILTSLGTDDLSIFGTQDAEDKVLELAGLVQASGCRALVCSGQEVSAVRKAFPDLWTIVPGIRLAGDDAGDQSRVLTPAKAILAGANSLVVGRSITGAKQPDQALARVLDEVQAATAEQG